MHHSENHTFHRFGHHAMNTYFEILIDGVEKAYAEQAATEAFIEIDRLEQLLSRFIANSDIAQINALRQFGSVIVTEDTFRCIKDCSTIYQETRGAFDVSAGPVIDLWKNSNLRSEEKAIQQALNLCGMPWLTLDDAEHRITLMNTAIRVDLGGYGKGYALDAVKDLLVDWDIPHFLAHSGQSTLLAHSKDGSRDWPVALNPPGLEEVQAGMIRLKNQSLSASGLQKGAHIVDPRSGQSATGPSAAFVLCRRAALADALSTAFMIMNEHETEKYVENHGAVSAMLIYKSEKPGESRIHQIGLWPEE